MTNVISTLTARAQLGRIIKRASQDNERFVIRRHGEPKVVLLSLQDYIRTIAPPPKWLERIWAQSRRQGLDQLTLRDIDGLVADVRRRQKKPSR